jgi:hypothetical protein
MSFCGKIFSKSLVLRIILQELYPIGLQRWHHLHMLHLVLIFKVKNKKKEKNTTLSEQFQNVIEKL